MTHPPVKVLSFPSRLRVIRTAMSDCFMGLLRGLFCAD